MCRCGVRVLCCAVSGCVAFRCVRCVLYVVLRYVVFTLHCLRSVALNGILAFHLVLETLAVMRTRNSTDVAVGHRNERAIEGEDNQQYCRYV